MDFHPALFALCLLASEAENQAAQFEVRSRQLLTTRRPAIHFFEITPPAAYDMLPRKTTAEGSSYERGLVLVMLLLGSFVTITYHASPRICR